MLVSSLIFFTPKYFKTSSKIRIVVTPNSTDVVAVRNQILQIDFTNTTVSSEEDTIAGGGSSAGVGYTTTTSY